MRRKVLIVEDNEMNRRILIKMLQKDYNILDAIDGVNAIEILKKEHDNISAVLLDLMMPRMNGFEVLQEMQSDPQLMQIPVIVATGTDDKGAEKKALEYGAIDYVTKPYDVSILRNRLWNTIKLREQAAIVNATRIDALTGLYSRSAFIERAGELIAEHEPGYFIMACFDIDRFKVINDQYGTEKGDEVLRHIADIFREGFGKAGGIGCRVMADHFAILYPKEFVYSDEIAGIRKRTTLLDSSIPPITFSIGRYIVDDLSLSPSTMFDRAVLAKETVKGRYDEHIAVYEESMRLRILKEQEITGEMKEALTKRQFEVFYQPQVNHASKAVVGAEALVRWRHPVKGLISPGVFIPVFEKNGFIYEVDKFVWEEACAFLREMKEDGRDIVPISVNISRYDAFHEDLVPVILSLVKKYDVPIDSLRLEITESAFADSGERIIEVVREFQEHGFTMEIDDFGSGYSSLNTLKDVPADVLKLDMKFLEGKDETSSERGGNIIESVVRMARWLGMSIVAEGVEEKGQADFLKSIGCLIIQGYLYSKPIPKTEYQELLYRTDTEELLSKLHVVENYDNSAFWNPSSLETLIFNSYIGAASVFELSGGNVEIIRVNDKYAEILTGQKSIDIDKNLWNWNHYLTEESKESTGLSMKKAIMTHEEVTDEIELVNVREGKERLYLRVKLRVIARSGERYLFYCVMEDITKRKLLEMKEQMLTIQLHMILENIGTGITATTVDQERVEYLFLNDQFYQMLGYTKEQYQKEVSNVFSLAVPEDREKLFVAAQKMNQSNEPVLLDYRIVRRDQKVRWLRLFGVQSKTKLEGRPVQVCVFRDITEEQSILQGYLENTKRLQKLNDEMNHLIDDTPGGFVRQRRKGPGVYTIEFLNQGYCSLINMKKEEILSAYGENATLGIHPEDMDFVISEAEKMWEKKGTLRIRYRLMKKDGSYVPVMAFGRVTQDQQGEEVLNIYFSDITEVVREEERRKELVDNLPCGIGIYEYQHGKLRGIYLNKVYWQLVGKEPYDITKVSVIDLVPEEEREHIKNCLEKSLGKGERLETEIHIKNGKGGYSPFQVTGNVIKRKSSGMTMYAVYMPIYEKTLPFRKVLPIAMRTMMSSSNDLCFLKDRSLHYICATRAFAKMVGISDEKEIIGKTDFDLFEPRLAKGYFQADKNVIKSGESLIDFIEEIPSDDGTPRYSSTSKYLLKDENGEALGLYGVGRDITDSKEAYSRLKVLTDNIPGGLVRYEVTKDRVRSLYISDGIRRLTDYNPEEHNLIMEDPIDFILEEDRELVSKKVELLRNGENLIDVIFRIRLMDGAVRFINMKGEVAERRNGSVFVNTVMLDVTKQHYATEQLERLEQENRKKYEHELQLRNELVKNSLFYYQLNLETGELTEYVSQLNDISKIKKGAILSREVTRSIFEKIHPSDQKRMKSFFSIDSLRAFQKKGGTQREEIYQRLLPNGEYHYVKAEISIMEKPAQRESVAFIFCTDVDEKYRSQLAVESILQDDIESVIYVNRKNGMARVAHMKKEINTHGLKREFSFQTEIKELCEEQVDPASRKKYLNFFDFGKIEKRLKRERVLTFSYPDSRGTVKKRKQVSVYYLDKEKETLVVIGRDITKAFAEEQRQKEELLAAVEKANAANRAKSEFLSHMSHDIRTPLNAVLAFSNEEMLAGADKDKLQEYLLKVNNSGEYLLGIVNDVLDMSRIEQNKVILNPEPYYLEDFAKTIRNVIDALCRKKNITFELNTEKAGSAVVVVDHVRFNQIVMNLLSNAVKFTNPGGRVELILEEELRKNKVIKRIIVKDNGIGMSEEFIPKAFDSFNQEYRKEASERNQGTGLGLSIVKELVRLMKGEIFLTSRLNVGTTFVVELPFLKNEVYTQKPQPKKNDFHKLKNIRILLAEDNSINMEIAEALLEKKGCIVEWAENGEEACKKFAQSPLSYYQLVLMDIRMPVMDGLTASKKIRRMKRADAKTVPIIAMTADAFTEDEQIAKKAGMDGYVGKPFRPEDLYSVCCRFL